MTARSVVVGSDGRAKAYRPLPESDRAAALAAGLAAYEQGDFFAAHEHLEPAWMGTDDLVERAWLQGLIKLAAAYVHAVRGNPAGIARNLEGARSPAGRGRASGTPRSRAGRLAARPRGSDRGDRPAPGRSGRPSAGPTLEPPVLPRSAQ